MARGEHLGEFEQVVLLAVARLGDDAYGMRIRQTIEDRSGRTTSIGAVYATLDRLELKGYVRHRDQAGGRARRFFQITPAAVEALEAARTLQTRMWAGVQLRRAARKP
jgi:DNA-binding PadR family transcriptional regulator